MSEEWDGECVYAEVNNQVKQEEDIGEPAGGCAQGWTEDSVAETLPHPSRSPRLTYGLDVKAPRWFQGPPGPPGPEHLQVNLFPLDEQHTLGDPAQEEDLGEGVCQRFVPEMLHVDGFETGEHVVAAAMLEVQRGRR